MTHDIRGWDYQRDNLKLCLLVPRHFLRGEVFPGHVFRSRQMGWTRWEARTTTINKEQQCKSCGISWMMMMMAMTMTMTMTMNMKWVRLANALRLFFWSHGWCLGPTYQWSMICCNDLRNRGRQVSNYILPCRGGPFNVLDIWHWSKEVETLQTTTRFADFWY